MKRQLTAPSFRLSGSGWYETDFKKDGDKKRNLTEKGEGAASKPADAVTPAAAKSEAQGRKQARGQGRAGPEACRRRELNRRRRDGPAAKLAGFPARPDLFRSFPRCVPISAA